MFHSWLNLTMLAAESQQVVMLRLIKFATGGALDQVETDLMISEKIGAATEAMGHLFLGASADSVVSDYRKTVQANMVRLSA